MFIAIISGQILALLFWFVAGVSGWFHFSDHIVVGVSAGVFMIFIGVFSLFFLIGSGKGIKDGFAGKPEYDEVAAYTKLFKKRCFPFLSATILCAVLNIVLGGAVGSGAVSPGWHLATFLFTFALSSFTFTVTFLPLKHSHTMLRKALG